jgi:hypothetical protein
MSRYDSGSRNRRMGRGPFHLMEKSVLRLPLTIRIAMWRKKD